MTRKTEGGISNIGKNQQQKFLKVKVSCHLYICGGESHFLGLRVKWSERSQAQGCPHTRYAIYIHEQLEQNQEEGAWR